MTLPRVTVGMAVFNAMPFLPHAVEAIKRQTLEEWELIVTDDGSTDGSREWLAALPCDPRIRVMLQPRRLGLVGNKNVFLAEAQGEFVTQLDADDLCVPDRLQRQLAAFAAEPELAIVSSAMWRIDTAGRRIGRVGPAEDIIVQSDCHRPSTHAFWFAPMMFRRSLLTKVGMLHSYFREVHGEDRYWGMNALRYGPALILGHELYSYRAHDSSMTNVLDDPRKLILVELLDELERQQREDGQDMLQRGDEAGLRALEQRLLADRQLLAARLRLWAAKAVDFGNYGQALRLLVAAAARDLMTPQLAKTASYLARKTLAQPFRGMTRNAREL
jgi:glycosyltransferase involved in cell wall biosynthesis